LEPFSWFYHLVFIFKDVKLREDHGRVNDANVLRINTMNGHRQLICYAMFT